MQILVSIGPVVEEKSCHKLNMNDKEKRSIKSDIKDRRELRDSNM